MTNGQKLVVYVGPYAFPDGGAAARRIYGNCISLKSAGYDVVVTSGQMSDEVDKKYNGIPVVSLNERRHEDLPTLLKHLMYFSAGKVTVDWLNSLDKKPESIILYSGYSPYLFRLLPWAKKNGVKIIFDVVEWYDPPNLMARFFSPYYLNIELAMRYLIKRCDGLIVISDYLRKYYAPAVKNIVQVPPTVDLINISPSDLYRNQNSTKFVYAGTPGSKDALSSIIAAVFKADALGERVEFHIAGVPIDRLVDFLPSTDNNSDFVGRVVKCHGVLSHMDTMNLVRTSDYSIILRPDKRSIQAGFPTKFVESMAVGTPVIANLTSDLGRYLKDGFNGFVCPNSDIDSLVEVIKRCSQYNDRECMRLRARETAESYFAPEVYSDEFLKLIG
ncbi:Glycosyltransferase involved in cell wall bisynthesis [Marinobacter antarcticus]|uniref:Glycosyltransferase involved in cell wall bisynthesis n=1 Tax=Marinobacter antarcticus TaxID=564117 RepID=A0A1M6RWK0_9GAMM|nr:glycosyltransferase [Marinobacter antarcticus]SHK36884.1 Glycosyltransferase involved in cell wall bisynthesis [Marinobacter antarcticus]